MRLPPVLLSAIWLLGFGTVCTRPLWAAELTMRQGGVLVRLAFDHKVRHIKNRGGYGLDSNPADFDSRYYHYGVLGTWSADSASSVLGFFAVNRLTAEVWDTYAECRKVTFPALRAMQQRYRRLYDLPDPRAIADPDRRPRLC